METPVEYLDSALIATLKLRGFKVSRNSVPKSKPTAFGRRHYYLIILSIGDSKVHYDDHTIHLDGVYLLLANPKVPYATEILSENQTGYSCVFTDDFIKPLARLESLQHSPLFKIGGTPAFKLNLEQQSKLTEIFETMIANETTDYSYKDDLMRNYIQLIIHEALQMRPAEYFTHFNNALLRITTQFMEVLERQFPIESPNTPLQLKTAQDYAANLCIHVNYLNRAVKETTGKSTTTIIAERITAEAKSLLQYTDWSVADIAFALGFEYPNYFSNFFKKVTGNTPKHYRVR
ncbi:AraC family transcriptional regulator [Bacteroides sp.]|uniref:helix-turn-helix domain-containing protein n=1 Tax=Bacteroides sp. TaxID=29523 RepID=UPI0026353BA8|nr:helix-turn-helix domain-containing protein [Bacteroides sp.]